MRKNVLPLNPPSPAPVLSEALLRQIIERSKDLIAVLGRDARITYMNPALVSWCDGQLSDRTFEAPDFRFHSLLSDSERKSFEEILGNLSSSKASETLRTGLHCEGHTIVIEWDFFPAAEDITIAIGKALSSKNDHGASPTHSRSDGNNGWSPASRNTIFNILDRITDGFFAIDRNWRVLYVNKEAERIARATRLEIVGRNIWEVAPETVGSTFYHKYHEAMEKGEPVSFVEYFPPFQAWFENYIYPSEEGLTIYFRDVSEKVAHEQARQETIEKLERLTTELARSNEELEQFAAVAAHDIKEPLRMIYTHLQLIRRKVRGNCEPDIESYIAQTLQSSQSLFELVNALLTYSRVGREQKPYVEVPLNEVVAIAKTNLMNAIEESKAQISSESLPTVLGDKIQLVQVFQNLISNGIKFCKERRPEIHIGAEEEAKFWIISIRDNGIGIDSAYFEKIFQVFQRLHSKAEFSGSGIGLASTKKIIERHGGRIWISSKLDQGSIFHFSLPKG